MCVTCQVALYTEIIVRHLNSYFFITLQQTAINNKHMVVATRVSFQQSVEEDLFLITE